MFIRAVLENDFDLGDFCLRDLATTTILEIFCAAIGRHGNPSGGNYVAITIIHGIVCRESGHHGKSSRENRPPRELATTGIHGGFSIGCFSQKASTMGFHRTGTGHFFFGI